MLKEGGYLAPFIFQVLGILFLVGSAVYFLITHDQPTLFVGAGLSLIAYGSAGGAFVTFRHDTKRRAEEKLGQIEETRTTDEEAS